MVFLNAGTEIFTRQSYPVTDLQIVKGELERLPSLSNKDEDAHTRVDKAPQPSCQSQCPQTWLKSLLECSNPPSSASMVTYSLRDGDNSMVHIQPGYRFPALLIASGRWMAHLYANDSPTLSYSIAK